MKTVRPWGTPTTPLRPQGSAPLPRKGIMPLTGVAEPYTWFFEQKYRNCGYCKSEDLLLQTEIRAIIPLAGVWGWNPQGLLRKVFSIIFLGKAFFSFLESVAP